jgi:hypothetical protein
MFLVELINGRMVELSLQQLLKYRHLVRTYLLSSEWAAVPAAS